MELSELSDKVLVFFGHILYFGHKWEVYVRRENGKEYFITMCRICGKVEEEEKK